MIFSLAMWGLGRMSTVLIGAGHVLISCLRLVAFMYNRQQKWLMEQRLPDLTFLRHVLRLGPQRVGKDVAHPGTLWSVRVVRHDCVTVWIYVETTGMFCPGAFYVPQAGAYNFLYVLCPALVSAR